MKIIIKNIEYIVKDNNVKCKGLVEFYNDEFRESKFVVETIATLDSNDKFDFEKGKRIALAKLENKAYKIISKGIKASIEDANEFIEEGNRFLEKANKCIEHNIEYMRRVDFLGVRRLRKRNKPLLTAEEENVSNNNTLGIRK